MSLMLSVALAAMIQDAPPAQVEAKYPEMQGVYDVSFRNRPVMVNVLGADGSYISIDPAGNKTEGEYEVKGKNICYMPKDGDKSCWFQSSRVKDGWRKMINRKSDIEIWVKRRDD